MHSNEYKWGSIRMNMNEGIVVGICTVAEAGASKKPQEGLWVFVIPARFGRRLLQ